ncbi:MAG: hypothetical protein K5751_04245 [Treponemataceae bacterium]|nr:hypothetical protein [Treponemataceae bacterium]
MKIELNTSKEEVSFGEYRIQMNDKGGVLYKNKEEIIEIKHSPPWNRSGVTAAQVGSCKETNFINLSLQEQILFALLASVYENYIKHKLKIQKGYLLLSYKEAMNVKPAEDIKIQKKLLRGANERIFFGKKDSPRQILKFAKIGATCFLTPGSVQKKEAMRIFKKIKKIKIIS